MLSSGIIKLSHVTVKEYLISERLSSGAAAEFTVNAQLSQSSIAQTCLAYLLHLGTFASLNTATIASHPLALYAAEHWISHVRQCINIDVELQSILSDFFLSASHSFNNWVRLHDVNDRSWKLSKTTLDRIPITISSPVYYASFLGLDGTVRRLLKANADANVTGRIYGSALSAAAIQAHAAVVKELLSHGVCHDDDLNSALKEAFALGHSGIVTMLLEAPSDTHWKSKCLTELLHTASQTGDDKTITRLLLQTGADALLRGELATGLQHACEKGSVGTAKLFLEKGADPNGGNKALPTALQYASWRGHEGIVRLLLSKSLNTGGRRGNLATALQSASHHGHISVVSLLLDNGAHDNDEGRDWATALTYASEKGRDRIVDLLLKSAPNPRNSARQAAITSALETASKKSHHEIVRLLLEQLPDPNGIIGQAALATALRGARDRGIKRLLLDKGANVNFLVPGRPYSSPGFMDVLQNKPRALRGGTPKSTRSGHHLR